MAKQEPKGESEESNRMWASASFVGVLIIIGLPLWWKTTEVYRVAIPTDKIAAFDARDYKITSELTVVSNDDAAAAEVAGLIQKSFQNSDVLNLKVSKSRMAGPLDRLEGDEHASIIEVSSDFDLGKKNAFYVVQKKDLKRDVWIGKERVLFFRDAAAAFTVVETLKKWVYQISVVEGARSESADAARQTRFPPSEGYHIVLSVVLPKPGEFDAESAVEDYIGSFVDELSELHNFTLKSQFLYMLNFDFQAKEMRNVQLGRHFAVRQDRLPLLLTRLEERAASGAPQPTINLALYSVPCATSPLLIYTHDDKPVDSPIQAFMSPKWGGVVLASPSSTECEHGAWSPDVTQVMGTFVSQLRKLLGIHDMEDINGAYLEPLRSVAPRSWEVDTLLRIRTLEQLTSATRTLQSLAQLLGEISNIVINDDVGASISAAVAALEIGAGEARGGSLEAAHEQARRAAAHAHHAFMEPSLLALLYFPSDQKYAIYIPLFLPVMFPVVLSLRNLISWIRGKPVHKEKTE